MPRTKQVKAEQRVRFYTTKEWATAKAAATRYAKALVGGPPPPEQTNRELIILQQSRKYKTAYDAFLAGWLCAHGL